MKKRKLVISFDAPVTLGFSALCLLALLLGAVTGGASTRRVFSVYRSSPLDPLFYVRLFGHVFGHANFSHLIGNLSMLLIIGPNCERRVGGNRLAAAMAVTAVVSGLVYVLLFPSSALLGASGVVYMLIFLSALGDASEGEIPLTLILVAVLYLGKELYGMLFQDNVSQLTHVVGAVCGVVCGRLLAKR